MINKRHLATLLFAAFLFFQPRIAMAVRCDTNEPALGRWELISALRRDAFSNTLDEYTELTRVGFEVMAGFSPQLSVAGLLGQVGFFDNFIVTFDYTPHPPE